MGRQGFESKIGTTDLATIVDGTSNTHLVNEKQFDRTAFGKQGNDNEGYTAGWDSDTVCAPQIQPLPDSGGGGETQAFGSSHPGAFNAVFADGSVHSINYSVNLTAFQWLCATQDGQVLPEGTFN